MENRFLNIIYAIEGLNSRLNTSSKEVEKGGQGNISFTKKINGNAYVSSVCVKKNEKEWMKNNGYKLSVLNKNGDGDNSQVIPSAHPHKFINEDVFGMALLTKESITPEEYEELDDDMKKIYKCEKKKYIRNTTKKRRSALMLNGLIGVNKGRVKDEFGVCKADNGTMLYKTQTYSDILVGIGNFNINQVGRFVINDEAMEFRDYSTAEAEVLGVAEELPKEERLARIETTLRGLQYLSLKSNQSNYLTDTMPKIVILGEYKWGNNVFQGLINKDGVNIEGLKEVIEEYDDFRKSDIWIGVSNRILNENFQDLKSKLEKELMDFDCIKIGGIKNAFDGYLNYLQETLE